MNEQTVPQTILQAVSHTVSLRDHVGKTLCRFGEDERIFVLDSDLAKSTTSIEFFKKYPDRFVELGIAEQSAVSVASGLAMEGKIAFYVNFSIFVTGTAWTQLRQACYANLNVKLIGTHPGMDNGPDGATHHANEDIACARVIPNLMVLVPASLEELEEAIRIAIEHEGPVYIRTARDAVPADVPPRECKPGKARILYDDGDDAAIIFEGTAAKLAYESYQALKEQGFRCKLINVFSIKPLDTDLIGKTADAVRGIVTVENHSIVGGLGSAVAEALSMRNTRPRLAMVGVADCFTESGKTAELKSKYGLNVANVVDHVKRVIE
ncbi:MAG TPA: transketolase C-terminal domain-containing protein [Anaerovoracaceae bacterium]|nr:transketolase C-terminal domain-containing protein [Anaerovoracaceae bacterium]